MTLIRGIDFGIPGGRSFARSRRRRPGPPRCTRTLPCAWLRPLGPLGFEGAQHRQTLRPSSSRDPQQSPASFRSAVKDLRVVLVGRPRICVACVATKGSNLTWNSFNLGTENNLFLCHLKAVLCHGKDMSALEIDAYHDMPCMGAIQLPNLGGTVRTESSLRYLRRPGCCEVRRGIGITNRFMSSSKICTGQIAAENSGSRAA